MQESVTGKGNKRNCMERHFDLHYWKIIKVITSRQKLQLHSLKDNQTSTQQ